MEFTGICVHTAAYDTHCEDRSLVGQGDNLLETTVVVTTHISLDFGEKKEKDRTPRPSSHPIVHFALARLVRSSQSAVLKGPGVISNLGEWWPKDPVKPVTDTT